MAANDGERIVGGAVIDDHEVKRRIALRED
jgi:hypothetical protein